jgi:hypothetical protein
MQYAKAMKEIRETEKEKEVNEIKMKSGLREPLGPETERDPQPIYYLPEPIHVCLPSSADRRDPPARPSSSPRLPPPLETAGRNYFPLQSPLIPALIDPSTVTIKPFSSSLISPLFLAN